MTRFLSLLAAALLALPTAHAQVGAALARVTVGAVYQHYDDDAADLTQLSVPLTASVQVAPGLGLALHAWYASSDGSGADGAGLAPLNGIADAQVALNYHRPVGPGSVVAGLAANLPSGDAAVTAGEAETAFLVGQGFFGFRLPSLGQGLNVTPSLTYAFPVAEDLALGVGASYQYRGPFEPQADAETEYDPGAELLLTAGLNVRLGEASTAALDASYLRYGEDAFGDFAYTTGDALVVTGQWKGALGVHGARVLGRVRLKGESTFPEALGVVVPDAAVPTSGRVLGHVRFGLGGGFHVGALAQGRYYAASGVFEERALLDVGVLPEIEVAPGLSVTGRAGATLGDLRGFEVGAGLVWGR